MTTDKKHIAVYLDKENEKSLMEYIKQHGGIKYSAAVNQILSTFFGNSLSNLPVTDELEATIKRIVEEQLSKIPSIPPSSAPIDEVLERLSNLEKKLEFFSNRPETIPGNLLVQEVVEPEQILSNIPGIIPSEVETVSVEVTESSPDLAVDTIDTPNTPPEPDPETVPGISESAPSEQPREQLDSGTRAAVEKPKPLNQEQLGRRLNCTSSSVNRHKTKPNFTDWSRERDPGNVGWSFNARKKMFYPVF